MIGFSDIKGYLGNLWHRAKQSIGDWAKSKFPSLFPKAPELPPSQEEQIADYYRRNPGQESDRMVTKPIKPRLPKPMPDALDVLFGTSQSRA